MTRSATSEGDGAPRAGTPVFDAHRERLTRAFAHDVGVLRPASLLDVGCGAGLLLSELSALSPHFLGLERSAQRVTDARGRGLDVHAGDACALPFGGKSFDWVVIRHVLHHLDDPARAVGEAWRVARSGVVLAEPWCDPSIPAQVEFARFDAFTTELLARSGHIHHPYLGAGPLTALLPGDPASVVTRTYGELTRVPEAEVRALAAQAAGEPGLTEEDSDRLEAHARAAAAGELAYGGSTAVFVRRT